MIFYKIWKTHSQVFLGHNCSCISNETFYFNDVVPQTSCRAELKQRLLVECRKLDHSIVVAAISQWRRRLSACVMAHDGHFVVFSWFSVLS